VLGHECVQKCRKKGPMVAQYCESLEVLQNILQIDHLLTKKRVNGPYYDIETTPLGLLCGRSEFTLFHKMLSCLIEVDSTVKVIYDGVLQCMCQYKSSSYQDISPGSRGDSTLILLGKLIDANADVANHDNCTIKVGMLLPTWKIRYYCAITISQLE
jgi:hypothetical protein